MDGFTGDGLFCEGNYQSELSSDYECLEYRCMDKEKANCKYLFIVEYRSITIIKEGISIQFDACFSSVKNSDIGLCDL